MIGRGHFGTVKRAVAKNNKNFITAVKTIPKRKLRGSKKLLRREIEILSTLDHPNIIKLYSIYEDIKYFHLVTEYCPGGELFERIIDKGNYSEKEASLLM